MFTAGRVVLLKFIDIFNFVLFVIFTVLYSYQAVYTAVALFSKYRKNKKEKHIAKTFHRYAVLVAARNEEAVIGELIKSIRNQSYPRELVDIFVIADNCSDHTAQAAKAAGATVYVRNDIALVGKGYALNYMLGKIKQSYADKHYEGFFVFDADNILDENYITEMNNVFDQGYRVLTSYRNSKNYDYNWITSGYALWFLHEAEYLNRPRMELNTSCAISGTGFLIHRDVIEENGGWRHYLLTEDIEFSMSEVLKGEVIGYCGSAMLYDEQPITFEQSWHQRMRWAKGFYQVLGKYGKDLLMGTMKNKKHKFSCYDMMMNITPALLISLSSLFMNLMFFIAASISPDIGYRVGHHALLAMFTSLLIYYLILFAMGMLTTITEWKKIHCTTFRKIWNLFMFPFFMFTYLPISVVALFKKVEWRPIAHTCVKSLEDVR